MQNDRALQERWWDSEPAPSLAAHNERAQATPSTFGVCHNQGASLCFTPIFSADGKPGRTHVLVPAMSCKFGLAWSDGPGGFSGSEAPQWAETCSSCLSDPQVKDEDKSLAVKRPVKEDGAVSVTGHGQGGAFGDGACPWWEQPL